MEEHDDEFSETITLRKNLKLIEVKAIFRDGHLYVFMDRSYYPYVIIAKDDRIPALHNDHNGGWLRETCFIIEGEFSILEGYNLLIAFHTIKRLEKGSSIPPRHSLPFDLDLIINTEMLNLTNV